MSQTSEASYMSPDIVEEYIFVNKRICIDIVFHVSKYMYLANWIKGHLLTTIGYFSKYINVVYYVAFAKSKSKCRIDC